METDTEESDTDSSADSFESTLLEYFAAEIVDTIEDGGGTIDFDSINSEIAVDYFDEYDISTTSPPEGSSTTVPTEVPTQAPTRNGTEKSNTASGVNVGDWLKSGTRDATAVVVVCIVAIGIMLMCSGVLHNCCSGSDSLKMSSIAMFMLLTWYVCVCDAILFVHSCVHMVRVCLCVAVSVDWIGLWSVWNDNCDKKKKTKSI